ncbi:MAG: UDP-N-acetylmuramate dehydrogenase [Pirellulales bacterium]|nr:UDP-N-acetylmuramate dehydrogenase [Pirellulales bacterium]
MPILSGFEKIVRTCEPLAARTSFRLGGAAEYFAEPETVDQLAALVRRCHEQDVPIRILGGGSNLLIRDEGVHGMVITLAAAAFRQIHIQGNQVVAGGGAHLGHVVSAAVRAGLAGLEPLVGIPGSLGGALHGNTSSRGGDIGQWASAATVMMRNGEILQRERSELVFGYRQSSLDELAILNGQFELEQEDPEQLTKRMQKLWIVKKANQPMSHLATGYIFKNPRDMSASMLIDQAGLKGTHVGGAEVCQQNSNFIIAHEGTSSQDVLKLIDVLRSHVAERLGVELEMQLEIW